MYEIFNSLVISSLLPYTEGYSIVIDSGHGWLTAGKQSIDGSLRENEFNTSVEDKLAMLFHFCNIEYHQTAADWKDEGLRKRKEIENKLFLEAETKDKILIGLSIHADGFAKDTRAHGFCVYYFKKGRRESAYGKRLARCIADSIIQSDYENGHVIQPRHDKGIKGQNYFMLRETVGIWILIENAFMTCERDLSFLKSDGFRNNRAYAIFNGLLTFTKT